MHIPDGYLSPQTCAVLGAGALPFWGAAAARARAAGVRAARVGVGAALSFLVMMLNVPVPDGTSAHAVGAVLLAIVLGPWGAVIAVSVALVIQAFLFGDGGILALGANVLNLAVIMPFTGYAVYTALTRVFGEKARPWAAAVGGYVGINLAALATAVELGIQPVLFRAADGTPLYSPYHLAQTVPAMAFAHLIVAGPVEAVLTGGAVGYLARVGPQLLEARERLSAGVRWRVAKALIPMVILVLLTPLGLLAKGTAFAEDAPEDLPQAAYPVSFIPEGMARWNSFWKKVLIPDYGQASRTDPLAYVLSGAAGAVLVGGVAAGLAMGFSARKKGEEGGGPG